MRRPLDIQETLNLYEARVAIERECLRLAMQRAGDAQIDEARAYLDTSRQVWTRASICASLAWRATRSCSACL